MATMLYITVIWVSVMLYQVILTVLRNARCDMRLKAIKREHYLDEPYRYYQARQSVLRDEQYGTWLANNPMWFLIQLTAILAGWLAVIK